jgi:hypothetical protein
VVSFTPRPLYLRGKSCCPDTHWISGWVGIRAALEVGVDEKILNPCWDSKLRSSSPYPSAIPLSYAGSRGFNN